MSSAAVDLPRLEKFQHIFSDQSFMLLNTAAQIQYQG